MHHLPRPRQIDDRIDHDVGDVHPLRPEVARHRLGQDALRRLGGREAGEVRLSTQRRRVAGRDDGAGTRLDHRRREPAGEMQQPHDVDAEVLLEHRRVEVEKVRERAADGIVDQHRRRPELAPHGLDRRVHLRGVADVADDAARSGDLPLERRQPLAIARQHRDAIPARGEPARQRRSVPGPTPLITAIGSAIERLPARPLDARAAGLAGAAATRPPVH